MQAASDIEIIKRAIVRTQERTKYNLYGVSLLKILLEEIAAVEEEEHAKQYAKRVYD